MSDRAEAVRPERRLRLGEREVWIRRPSLLGRFRFADALRRSKAAFAGVEDDAQFIEAFMGLGAERVSEIILVVLEDSNTDEKFTVDEIKAARFEIAEFLDAIVEAYEVRDLVRFLSRMMVGLLEDTNRALGLLRMRSSADIRAGASKTSSG